MEQHSHVSASRESPINDALFSSIVQEMSEIYGEMIYTNWLSKLKFVEKTGSSVILCTTSTFLKDWIKSHYAHIILDLWKRKDSAVSAIEIVVQHTIDGQVRAAEQTEAPSVIAHQVEDYFSYLDPRLTFDNFVVGKPNEFAYEASRAVAESRSVIAESNPLFLYGGVGLGKTHLMHAIAWSIKKNSSYRKVAYMSAESFMHKFVKALRNKDVMSFKDGLRSVDVLMIDDIQFICGKDSTQEEFFHTFNTIMDNNRQMVISCDRSPSDLDNIEDRIRSRLGWGLVADVHSTTYELRLGILYSKIEQMGVHIPQEVIEFLAEKITSNVRELEGALNKVLAHAKLVQEKISVQSTKNILKDLLRSNQRLVSVENIQKVVAKFYDIRVADMQSNNRLRKVSRSRQIAMYLTKNFTKYSLAEIGKRFGGKDHTTVMYAIEKVEELMRDSLDFKQELDQITHILLNS
ncbi:Chromosomal replication initiator protein DnaA [Rickettsiales endosymbiont of Paramecium tredecaurelia]|uniref:chromosomal replication initiator protein DnaA n=1 Tax=Candidatus Sarmatiella mevalonica TaxID=2770581 RepID=UPI001920CB9C|nr:chromosomal replication initiator protein DnaA [Candidatus Sarmatiella mevalonica]MBL3284294.1 Chromosomal replication initiator protein DnaA [Candidatus Sarmatiella mevalonica]